MSKLQTIDDHFYRWLGELDARCDALIDAGFTDEEATTDADLYATAGLTGAAWAAVLRCVPYRRKLRAAAEGVLEQHRTPPPRHGR